MLDTTPALAADLRRPGLDLPAQVDRLRGAYEGASCVIVTCGPSLRDHDPAELRQALAGHLVIAVKQAISVVGADADFLCFNAYNASRYETESADTVRVYCEDPDRSVDQRNEVDVTFQGAPHSGDLRDSLAGTCDYEAAAIDANLLRPWGPGILHEVCFPLAVHLGVREITTIGWDIANDRGNNVHFYDDADDAGFFDKGRAAAHALTGVRKHLPPVAKKLLRKARATVQHTAGGLYNKTTMIDGEAEIVAASTPALQAWLAANGATLRVVSDQSLVSAEIPRVHPDAFYADV